MTAFALATVVFSCCATRGMPSVYYSVRSKAAMRVPFFRWVKRMTSGREYGGIRFSLYRGIVAPPWQSDSHVPAVEAREIPRIPRFAKSRGTKIPVGADLGLSPRVGHAKGRPPDGRPQNE